ncbi:hypothetical protein Pla175_02450 [Pirellulimonas nuda]|uniref:PepSY domain-containing protein n=1 Tax=Pirellulimonas nuda TaxID=2528009 RepID=A0A518D5Y5_9BACT|nr:hypothetical protein [Pirellulimonas nuda]QDU86891.1 hypothetical protein Pla175_02450 [Pirellulimonas nuda]
MATTAKIALAVEIAERSVAENGYRHGPCIAARMVGATTDRWEVELAYDGCTGRSATTDPPSIVLKVDLDTEQVTSVELM